MRICSLTFSSRLKAASLTLAVAASSCVSSPPYTGAMADDLDRIAARRAEPRDELPAFDGTLENYVRHALREHPQLLANYEEWRAATLAVDGEGIWPGPSVTYGLFVQSVETRVGPQRQRIGVSQPIPWPTKLSRAKDAAGARAKSKRAAFDGRMLQIRARVADLYWRLWLVEQLRHWQTQQEILLSSLTDALRGRLEIGQAKLADLNQVELRRSRTNDAIAALDEQRRQFEALLAAAVGATPQTALPVTTDGPPLRPEDLDEPTLIGQALLHPSVTMHEELRAGSEIGAKRAALNALPDFTIGVDYIETGASRMPTPPPDSGKDAVIAMVGIRIPLGFGGYGAAADAARAEASGHAADAQAQREFLTAEVRRLISMRRDALRRVTLYESTLIPQAEATYASVLTSYETGASEVAAVLLAQRELIELQVASATARAEVGWAAAALESVAAQPIAHDEDPR